MKKFTFLFLAGIFAVCSLSAQLRNHEKPYSFTHSFNRKNKIDEKVMPSIPSMKELSKEDSLDNLNGLPPRFGYLIKTDLNTSNSGTWEVLPDSSKIWNLTITSKGALSINLLYDKFWLPDSSTFFIYNASKSSSIGGFTHRNNKGTKAKAEGFATGLVYGDKITLEYYQPAYVKDTPIISIAYVIHGYRYINIQTDATPSGAGFGNSSSCEENINCSPDGTYWQNEKHAVALILVNGYRYCTGSLINTTAANATPYFLTACHCLGGSANPTPLDAVSNSSANYWSFYWDYESPNCSNPSSDITTAYSTSGATVVANYPQTDFALLKLTEDPKNIFGFTPYYLGWSRNGSNDNSGYLVGIHHPAGDIKKISLASSAVNYSSSINWTNGITTPANTHWNVSFYKGGIEPGSSGSPLLNSSHLVIGQLHGGNGTCAPVNMYYGRFDKSWEGDGSSPQRRLKDWLDPLGTDSNTLASTYAYPIFGPTIICNSGTYTVTNLPANATVTWNNSSNLTLYSTTTNMATFTANTDGAGWIQASINGIVTAKQNIWVGKPVIDSMSSTPATGGYSNIAVYDYLYISYQTASIFSDATWSCGSGISLSSLSGNEVIARVISTSNTTITVQLTNACGSSSQTLTIHALSNHGTTCSTCKQIATYSMSIGPNPATSTLTVNIANVDSSAAANSLNTFAATSATNTAQNPISNSAGVTNVYLFDVNTGQLAREWNYKEDKTKKYKLNVSGVQRGIYILRMERNNSVSTTKVILQ